MRILLTSGAGFIGSSFIRYVLHHYPGESVVNFDRLTYAGNLENLVDVADDRRHSFVRGEICDEAAVEHVLGSADAIVNFATQTHVDRSIQHATAFIDTDVKGLYVLLEAARKRALEHFLHVSTDQVYGSIG